MWFLEERCVQLGKFIIENETTIRKTAKVFGLSKSTVHNDLSNKLKDVNYSLYLSVQKVLDKNFAEKHIRGGIATKMKYFRMRTRV